MLEDQGENGRVETGIEEAAAYLANASKDTKSAPGFAQSTAAEQPRLNADQAAQVSETLKAAESYIRAGWRTFPGKRRNKEPKAGWSWTKQQLTLADAPKYFDKDQHNVNVALGECSGNLIDIDLDWPEAGAGRMSSSMTCPLSGVAASRAAIASQDATTSSPRSTDCRSPLPITPRSLGSQST